MAHKTSIERTANWYETNPFTLAVDGIKKLYDNARGMFWISLLIGIIGAFNSNFDSTAEQNQQQNVGAAAAAISTSEIAFLLAIITTIIAGVIALTVVLWGMVGYTASRLAKDLGTSIPEAFDEALANFWRLFMVGIILIVRLVGWTLLFIIPGIIMAIRYSLSAVIAFSEPELKPSQVVSKSASLTKGAWFDTFAAFYLVPLLSLGILKNTNDIAVQAKQYEQLSRLKQGDEKKPPTHMISYVFAGLLFLAVVAILAYQSVNS